eukprot:TRINITY_DN9272_c0_g7_i1.p1 TRINITY_DN9272_c0_g7~~TRINITY_DN9272_c0_g7_i1.p1  ORF type:complete len:341 (-),score=30.38 TRINITY_DN9272_c0_g7_i1:2013-3035(-)
MDSMWTFHFFIVVVSLITGKVLAGEIVFRTNDLDSVDWTQLPQDNDDIFHTWNLSPDGHSTLVAHKRDLLSTDPVMLEGSEPIKNIAASRKLSQLLESHEDLDIQDQAILGSDDRFRVTQTNTFPFSATGLLVFKSASGGERSQCTGTLISRQTILTSAHCLWDARIRAWNSEFTYYPGRNGVLKPFNFLTWQNIGVPGNWTQSGQTAYDYAVIVLEQPIGDTTGYFGFGYDCGVDVNPDNETYGLMGYPFDKNNELWMDTCNIVPFDPCDYEDPHVLVQHTCDTLGGQSGSVLWKIVNKKVFVKAIHQGYNSRVTDYNNAIAITPEVFQFILRNFDASK